MDQVEKLCTASALKVPDHDSAGLGRISGGGLKIEPADLFLYYLFKEN